MTTTVPDSAAGALVHARLTPQMRGVVQGMQRAGRPPLHSLSPARARAAYEAGAQRMHEGLRALIAAHRPDADAERQALSVRAELVGALLLARAQTDRAHSDALLAASRQALHARLGLD